jgi:hypothetical protein
MVRRVFLKSSPAAVSRRHLLQLAGAFFVALFITQLSASATAQQRLPLCKPDQAIPPGGCLRTEPAPGTPAPPLKLPRIPHPSAEAGQDSPAVTKPPPTGDKNFVPAPHNADRMPIVKPPPNIAPK